jgi:hypothetical protein
LGHARLTDMRALNQELDDLEDDVGSSYYMDFFPFIDWEGISLRDMEMLRFWCF